MVSPSSQSALDAMLTLRRHFTRTVSPLYSSPKDQHITPQTEVPPYRLSRLKTSPPITVIVDKPPRQKIFHVHSALLTHSSRYFRIALSSRFIEGEKQICRLIDDDAYAFDLYMQYLYTNGYDVTLAISIENGVTDQNYHRMHATAYALGNELVAPKFKQLVLIKLARELQFSNCTNMELVLDMARTIYRVTLPATVMR